jgi:hypothetical protein
MYLLQTSGTPRTYMKEHKEVIVKIASKEPFSGKWSFQVQQL